LTNCTNGSTRTITPVVTMTDANNASISCNLVNVAPLNVRSRGFVTLFFDSNLTRNVCFRAGEDSQLIFTPLGRFSQRTTETRKLYAVVNIPARDSASPKTVLGQIQSSVVFVTSYP
jgi:hypothetical protein